MKSIELFCGAGGLALGLQRAGFSHEALFEWDQHSCSTLQYNAAQGCALARHWDVHLSDVRNVNFGGYEGKIDLVSGGPPCQPFSLGGKHQAYNDKRDMFPEAIRAVRAIKPKAFIFENVKGLLRKSFDMYLQYIVLQLHYPELTRQNDTAWEEHYQLLQQYHAGSNHEGLRYNVAYQLVNAADYGVPQMRQRVIFVGFRADIQPDWQFPQPTHSQVALLHDKWISGRYWDTHRLKRPKSCPLSTEKVRQVRKLVEEQSSPTKPWRTVRDAIANLPHPQSENALSIHNHVFRDGAKTYIGHSGSELDAPSKTIKAGAHGVPGGENMVTLDDGSVRYYTIRESARIQTFPDDYIFCSSWTESMRQIGNAVPVRLANIVGESVYTAMQKS